MAIQRFLEAARDGTPIRVFGDGEQSRDFTFVGDIVEATRRAAETGTPGAVYNVGGGSRVTLNEVISTIESICGCEFDLRRESAKPGDVRSTEADCRLAEADLGYSPQTSLQEGIGEHWEWLTGSAGGS
jgi:UDP-glucose 4-epimerase